MRSISGPAATVLAGGVVPMALLLTIGTTPAIRLNSSAVTIQWGSDLFYGIGTLGAVDSVRDTPRETQPLRFTLSAVPSDVLALALSESIKGASVTLWLAILDPTSHAIVDVPQLFTGSVDQMPISRSGSEATVAVTASHRGDTFRRPKPLRNTDGDQQKLVPGDTSRRFVVSQSQVQDVWPAASFFRR